MLVLYEITLHHARHFDYRRFELGIVHVRLGYCPVRSGNCRTSDLYSCRPVRVVSDCDDE